MIQTKAEVKQELICKECKQEIYVCDDCGCYFDDNQDIICDQLTSEHFCKECYQK